MSLPIDGLIILLILLAIVAAADYVIYGIFGIKCKSSSKRASAIFSICFFAAIAIAEVLNLSFFMFFVPCVVLIIVRRAIYVRESKAVTKRLNEEKAEEEQRQRAAKSKRVNEEWEAKEAEKRKKQEDDEREKSALEEAERIDKPMREKRKQRAIELFDALRTITLDPRCGEGIAYQASQVMETISCFVADQRNGTCGKLNWYPSLKNMSDEDLDKVASLIAVIQSDWKKAEVLGFAAKKAAADAEEWYAREQEKEEREDREYEQREEDLKQEKSDAIMERILEEQKRANTLIDPTLYKDKD